MIFLITDDNNKIIELFHIYNNKTKIDSSFEKNPKIKSEDKIQNKSSFDKIKDKTLEFKSLKRTKTSEKPELIRKKTKLISYSYNNLDSSTNIIDDSNEKNIKEKAEQKNQLESSFDKRKDESLNFKSPKKHESIRNITKPADNSIQIRDLTTKKIDELLVKKVQLGKGATSTVYKVKNIFTNNGFLSLKVLNDEFFKKTCNENNMKEINWNDDDDDDDFEESDNKSEIDIDKVKLLLKEYEILNSINHPNIVTVYGIYNGDSKHNPSILLEYCKFNLEQVVTRIEDIYLVSIIYEICAAMNFVHQNKIIHRDLSIRNILINSEKHVKICDFGIAKVIDLTTLSSVTHGIGTLAFMAPEISNKKVQMTEKVDVYSFGVIMYFIVTKGLMPEFTGIGNYIKLEMPSNINKLSQQLIKACWSPQPEKRPSFESLLEIIVKENFLLINGIEKQIPTIMNHLGLE